MSPQRSACVQRLRHNAPAKGAAVLIGFLRLQDLLELTARRLHQLLTAVHNDGQS